MTVPSPKGAKPLNTLNPSAHGIDKIIMAIRFISTDFFLDQPKRSIAKEIIFSNTAIIVDKAAKTMNI